MAYMVAIGNCIVCKRIFSFNPYHVPSVVIAGEREPLCRSCVEAANEERAKRGLNLFLVLPDAYEEVQEGEDNDWKGCD
jgi:hypothetical protein